MVTAGLAESNGSIAGFMTDVTGRLSASEAGEEQRPVPSFESRFLITYIFNSISSMFQWPFSG